MPGSADGPDAPKAAEDYRTHIQRYFDNVPPISMGIGEMNAYYNPHHFMPGHICGASCPFEDSVKQIQELYDSLPPVRYEPMPRGQLMDVTGVPLILFMAAVLITGCGAFLAVFGMVSWALTAFTVALVCAIASGISFWWKHG